MLTQFFSLREVTQGGKNPKTSTSHHAQNIHSKNFLTVALSDGVGHSADKKLHMTNFESIL